MLDANVQLHHGRFGETAQSPICLRLLSAGLIALFAFVMPLRGETAEKMSLPFVEDFATTEIAAPWRVDVTGSSTLGANIDNNSALQVTAYENECAHVERPLGVADPVELTARIAGPASLFIVWDERNWIGTGKICPTPFGRFYSTVAINGAATERLHTGIHVHNPHFIRLQLGADVVRFFYSSDARHWTTLRVMERPTVLSEMPARLALGKRYPPAMQPFSASRASASSDPGVRYTGYVEELRIDRLAETQAHLDGADREFVRMAGVDRVTRDVLAKPDDPTFEMLAPYYPPMKFPREHVGVPWHPTDIGVDYLGRLDVSPWSPQPVAWLEIGTPAVKFGRAGIPVTRRLFDGWLPVLTLETRCGGATWEQTVFGWSEGFSPDAPMHAFVRLRMRGVGSNDPTSASLVYDGGRNRVPLPVSMDKIGAGELCMKMKYPEPASVQAIPGTEFDKRLAEVVDHWREAVRPAERFDIPDRRVSEACRAWLVYSMLNTDTVNGKLEPHDGSGFYEEVFGHSVSLHTMALDLYGLHDIAERELDMQLSFQQPDGLYTQACGLPDHGALMVGLATHYLVTADAKWLRRVAPQLVKLGDWALRQCAAAPKEGVARGLIKFRPYNDYPEPVFNYLGNIYTCVGLELAGRVLADADTKQDAERFAAEARKFKADILASMDKSAFKDGDLTILPIEPDTRRLLKLSNYRGGDYYGLVASCLMEMEFLPPKGREAQWLVDMLEKRGGLIAGVCEFMEGIDHAYTYGYLMNQYARDDVKKVLLGFWSMLAFGMTRDTYSPVEVSMLATGENHLTLPHLYSCTEQLRLLRNLMLREDGDTLRIGQAVPRAWLEPGKGVAFTSAPTTFGPVSCRISVPGERTMKVRLEPPTRRAPASVRIRLRHPAQLPIVEAKATPEVAVRVDRDELVLEQCDRPVDIAVRFADASAQQDAKARR